MEGLFFASTTSPYKEKACSSIVATVSDLRRDIWTSDFANSLRAGTCALRAALNAVKSGAGKNIIVTAADWRLGTPRSVDEQVFGDDFQAVVTGSEIEFYGTILKPVQTKVTLRVKPYSVDDILEYDITHLKIGNLNLPAGVVNSLVKSYFNRKTDGKFTLEEISRYVQIKDLQLEEKNIEIKASLDINKVMLDMAKIINKDQ